MGSTATTMVVWTARSVLAVVFGFACIEKFRDPDGSVRGALELDVPERFAPLVSRALPAVEAVIAVGVLVPATSSGAAVAGLLLLVMFTIAVLRMLANGRAPMCFCFGSRNAQPAGRDTVLRNIALAALCVVVAISP